MENLKINDKVKLILLKEPLTLSEWTYIVSDVLTIHSMKTDNVIKCKVILKDKNNRELKPIRIEDIIPIDKNFSLENIRISNENGAFVFSDSICKECGAVIKQDRKHIDVDNYGEGGYWADIFKCTRCDYKVILPD